MDIQHKIRSFVPLAPFSTFHVGGLADYLIEVESIEEMIRIRLYIKQTKLPFIIIGKGSNILFHDEGFRGLVIINRMDAISFYQNQVIVEGGVALPLLSYRASQLGWGGLEFLAGIPGSIGGAVCMNAGAAGKDMSQLIIEVGVINQDGQLILKKGSDCEFGYRRSCIQRRGEIVVFVALRIYRDRESDKKRKLLLHARLQTQPYSEKSAGCIFRNITTKLGVKSAGALIEACGLKGTRIGDALVSPLHGNFILNVGRATSAEIVQLIAYIQQVVREKTGTALHLEVQKIDHIFCENIKL